MPRYSQLHLSMILMLLRMRRGFNNMSVRMTITRLYPGPGCTLQILWALVYLTETSSSSQFMNHCFSNEVASSYHPADVVSWWCESEVGFRCRRCLGRYAGCTSFVTFDGVRSVEAACGCRDVVLSAWHERRNMTQHRTIAAVVNVLALAIDVLPSTFSTGIRL